jgi:hypothetical protein
MKPNIFVSLSYLSTGVTAHVEHAPSVFTRIEADDVTRRTVKGALRHLGKDLQRKLGGRAVTLTVVSDRRLPILASGREGTWEGGRVFAVPNLGAAVITTGQTGRYQFVVGWDRTWRLQLLTPTKEKLGSAGVTLVRFHPQTIARGRLETTMTIRTLTRRTVTSIIFKRALPSLSVKGDVPAFGKRLVRSATGLSVMLLAGSSMELLFRIAPDGAWTLDQVTQRLLAFGPAEKSVALDATLRRLGSGAGISEYSDWQRLGDAELVQAVETVFRRRCNPAGDPFMIHPFPPQEDLSLHQDLQKILVKIGTAHLHAGSPMSEPLSVRFVPRSWPRVGIERIQVKGMLTRPAALRLGEDLRGLFETILGAIPPCKRGAHVLSSTFQNDSRESAWIWRLRPVEFNVPISSAHARVSARRNCSDLILEAQRLCLSLSDPIGRDVVNTTA